MLFFYPKEANVRQFNLDGSDKDIVYIGSKTFGAGRWRGSKALVFDGSSTYLTVPPFRITGTDFTISAWIFPKSSYFRIITAGDYVTQNNYMPLGFCYCDGKLAFRRLTLVVMETANTIPTERWTHVAVTWNTASMTVQLFINGREAISQIIPDMVWSEPNNVDFCVGKSRTISGGSPTTTFSEGRITNLAVLFSALDSNEIQKLSRKGCPESDLGMSWRRMGVLNTYFSISSSGSNENPQRGRLHDSKGWCTASSSLLTIDLRNIYELYGIKTQGSELKNAWVKTFKVYLSLNGVDYQLYDNGKPGSEFIGNEDGNSIVRNDFTVPVDARYVRIEPVNYQTQKCMRVELYGCNNVVNKSTNDLPVSKDPVIVSSAGDNESAGIILYESLEEYKLDLRTNYGLWELALAHLNPYWSHLLITWNEVKELVLYYDGELIGKTSSFKPISPLCSANIRYGCSNLTGNALAFGRTTKNLSSYVIAIIQVADIILAEHELTNSESTLINWEAQCIENLEDQTCYWQNADNDDGNWELIQHPVISQEDWCNPWSYHNGFCYKYFNDIVTSLVAENTCYQVDSQLASVHSANENKFIVDLSSGSRLHLGLSVKTSWSVNWIDQTKLDYMNLKINYPFNNNRRCMDVSGDYFWYYSECFGTASFVCKKPAGGPVFHLTSSFPYQKGDKARLESSFFFGGYRCLKFKYLMKGSNVGRLNIFSQSHDEEPVLLWRLAGSQDNVWRSAEVNIDEDKAFKVIFEGIIGEGVDGTIRLSDIRLNRKNPCGFHPLKAMPPFHGNYRHLGCFKLKTAENLFVFQTEISNSEDSVIECANKVRDQNMEIFAMTNNLCLGGIKEYHETNEASKECNWNGGDGVMAVYVLSSQEYTCEHSWNKLQGHCYKIAEKNVNQGTGRATCQGWDSELVSIHSVEENEFVEKLIVRSVPFSVTFSWIGLNDGVTTT